LIGNFGYKFSDKLETRLTVRYGYAFFDQPGSLTLKQLQTNSAQANPANVATNAGPAQCGIDLDRQQNDLPVRRKLQGGVGFRAARLPDYHLGKHAQRMAGY